MSQHMGVAGPALPPPVPTPGVDAGRGRGPAYRRHIGVAGPYSWCRCGPRPRPGLPTAAAGPRDACAAPAVGPYGNGTSGPARCRRWQRQAQGFRLTHAVPRDGKGRPVPQWQARAMRRMASESFPPPPPGPGPAGRRSGQWSADSTRTPLRRPLECHSRVRVGRAAPPSDPQPPGRATRPDPAVRSPPGRL
jgi:hypothetical protein